MANAIPIPLPLCFSWFVLLRRFRENLPKPFYFYLSRTCGSPGGIPLVISLELRPTVFTQAFLCLRGAVYQRTVPRSECDTEGGAGSKSAATAISIARIVRNVKNQKGVG